MLQHTAAPAAPTESLLDVEILSATARVEWMCDRKVVCYWAAGASRETYRVLFDRAEQIMRDWPAEQMYLSIIDFLTGGGGMTPYARERGRTLNRVRSDLNVAISMVMERSVQASFTQLAFRAFQKPGRAFALHFSRGEALVWLKRIGKLA